MDRIKKARKPVRAAVTRAIGSIEVEMGKEEPSTELLDALQRGLDREFKRLCELDDQLYEELLDADVTEDDLEAENVAKLEYIARVDLTKVMVEKFLQRPTSPPPSTHGYSTATEGINKKNFKLPKIELKKFSGELTEWLGWWAQFQKIDEDEDLHASDKFQYLVQCMVQGTRARDLVDSYPQSKENYPKVVAALKERFGKAKLLKQVYVRELIKMIILKGREKWKLSSLFDKLESHLRSLESLGVTAEQMSEFLFPMVESCLPEDILIAWQRSALYEKDGSLENPPKIEMDFLMEFLKKEIDREGQRSLALAGFGTMSVNEKKTGHTKKKYLAEEDVPTAAGLFDGDSKKGLCIFCEKKHDSKECFKARAMQLEEKKTKIKEKRACYLCFKVGHQAKVCKAFVKCLICGQHHQALMCQSKSGENKKPLNASAPTYVPTTMSSLSCTRDVVLQTLMVKLRNDDNMKERTVRVLIDSGSQRSYILKKTANKLGFRPTQKITLNHMLFGGNHIARKEHCLHKVGLQNTAGNFGILMELLDQDQICGVIPRVENGPWLSELNGKHIQLSDANNKNATEVEVLIGSDNLGDILTSNFVRLSNGLTAVETRLGWTLMGRIKNEESTLAMNVISLHLSSASVADLWKLEAIGINDPIESKSKVEKELAAKKHFMETVARNQEGRYSVSLPWIQGVIKIPENKVVAEKRLLNTTNKLNLSGMTEVYDTVFKDWEKEGIISVCSEEGGEHYIPHRAVFKPESKTTPVRPVFDASCKVGRSPSLNECLEKGPNLLELIPSILLRFRIGKIGVISDIRKAFLMIEVNQEDRNFLRFLWWKDSDQKAIKIYRHNRVVFGMNCSPFLLGAVIEYHLGQVSDQDKEISQKLLKSLYVDNCVTSVSNKEEYEEFKERSTELLANAKMELRLWEFTEDKSLENVTSVLGLNWDKKEDVLYCSDLSGELVEKITKRVVLSQVQKIFDPLGFLCPAVLRPKLLLQQSWAEKLSWDEELGDVVKTEFQKWRMEIKDVLQKIKVPRNCTSGGLLDLGSYQIHSFCDASQRAYAAAVFLRVETENGVSVQLLQAKSRVAPLKSATIPRLELLSCSISARLTSSVKEALDLPEFPVFYWSDSTTALAWIKRNDEWGTFVGNRVREINSLSKSENWRHVPGVKNPADLPSRGCSPLQLLESRWWEGPEWLKLSSEEWPSGDDKVDEVLVLQERKKTAVSSMADLVNREGKWWITKHESYIRNVRVVALVLRYIDKLRKKSSETDRQPTQEEVNAAELRMFKLIQEDVLPVNENVIAGLRVELDEAGIIRVKTKLVNRQDSMDFRYPVLLPTSHPLVDKLIREEHKKNCHATVQILMGKLRERCWIIHARRAIKKLVKSCVICRRYTSKCPVVPAAALPENRVKDAKAFEVTGVDLAGPLILKDKSKSWIVIYTCAVYRCVHLELVQSMTTEDFLLSLVRFSSRKRRPNIIYSDNGTNFTGAANLFKAIDWNLVKQKTQQQRIQWIFNPPSAPWWGGWWERLIRSSKDLLKRMLGSGRLTFVQLETCLCQVESVLNDRPLSFVTNDQDDLCPLTPAMFMYDLTSSECPEAELLTIEGLQRKYANMLDLLDELKSRFRKEYLAQLVQRGKDQKIETLKVGDVVLVGMDNKKRVQWPMGRIIELFPGKDGMVRVAKVRTASGELVRPLQRLYPLEVTSTDKIPVSPPKLKSDMKTTNATAAVPKVAVLKTKSGRMVKLPLRFND